MDDIAAHYASKLMEEDERFHKVRRTVTRMRRSPLRLATACSGTDGIIKWLFKFNCTLGVLGMLPADTCFFDFAFACECNDDNVKFHKDQFGTSVPLFRDICELGNINGAWDHHTADTMMVPWVALLITGFSCKDVSLQSCRKRERSDVIRTGQHSTGATWFGVLNFLENNHPWVCLAENVEGLLNQVGTMREQVEALGYILHAIRLNAEQFCLPQKRPRIYFIIVHASYDDFPLADVLRIIELLKTQPLDIHTIISSRQPSAASSQVGELGGDSAKQSQHAGKKIGEKWFRQHRAVFQAAGLPFVTPTDAELGSCASPGLLSCSLRERSIIQYWTLHGCTEGFLDVSESLERFQPIYKDSISCITTSAVHYNFRSGDKLDLPTLWDLQGLDWNSWDNLNQYPDRVLKNLVGNSFSIPNAAAVLLALLFCLQWPRSQQELLHWAKRGIPPEPSPPSSPEPSPPPSCPDVEVGADIEDAVGVEEFGCSNLEGDQGVEELLASDMDDDTLDGSLLAGEDYQDLADMASLC